MDYNARHFKRAMAFKVYLTNPSMRAALFGNVKTDDQAMGGLAETAVITHTRLENIFDEIPDQVIINEYQPGQGIAPHIDCVPCFGKTIASLSLGSSCVMDFTHSKTGEKQSHLLEPRSLLVLTGDARYVWQHGIAGRKIDRYNGQILQRNRRVSLTFRKTTVE